MNEQAQKAPDGSETPEVPKKSPGFFKKYVLPNDIMEWFIFIFMMLVGGGLFVLMVIAFLQ